MLNFSKHVGLLLVVAFLSFIITACQVTEPSITPTATTSILADATENSSVETPTNTAIPATETAVDILPTTTPTHLPTPTASPTVLPTSTAVPPTPLETEPSVNIFQERVSLSPDGKWQAHTLLTFVEGDGGVVGYQTDLTVSTLEGDTSWLAYSTLQGAGLGYQVPTVVLWSNDNRSLFFTLRAAPDGCGGFLGQFDSELYQLDLISGEVKQLEVGGAISPDGATVASLVWEPVPAVQLYDLASRTTTTIAWDAALERGSGAMNLVWSPDNQAIALEYAATFCLEGGYSLIYLDFITGEQTPLLSQDMQIYSIVEWPKADEIYLQDRTKEGPSWSIDVHTGELTRIE